MSIFDGQINIPQLICIASIPPGAKQPDIGKYSERCIEIYIPAVCLQFGNSRKPKND